MYFVFDRNLSTDKGKALVREHEGDRDAQAIYKALCEHASTSTKAALDASDILAYITSARLGDGSWKGTTHAFILHWRDQVRRYEKQVKPSDHFSAGQKKVMLQNAVHPIPELRAVKVQADQLRTHNGVDVDYEQYVSLLCSAAHNYDGSSRSKGSGETRRRTIYEHELHDLMDDATIEPVDGAYDIDIGVDTIQANFTSSKPKENPSFMPKDRWDQLLRLPPSERQAWNKLSKEAKAIILGSRPPTGGSPATAPHLSSSRPPTTRTARFADLSSDDQLTVYQHAIELLSDGPPGDGEPSADSSEASAAAEGDGDLLLAHATNRTWPKPKAADLPPSDIRKVLSASKGGSHRDSSTADELTINGRTYRSVNMTCIAPLRYNVSAHARTSFGSLVDRGANGGVAGEDVRVIAKHPHRKVDIQGIDNHQLSSVPIATVGGVVSSQRGEVIAILHQYAYTGRGKTIHSAAQLESHLNDVNDRSVHIDGGLQRIKTVDGYVHPINICSGLPYVRLRPYTDEEWETLPHVVWTSDVDWDPSVLDHAHDDDDHWYDAVSSLEDDPEFNLFDAFGNYRKRVAARTDVAPDSFHDALDHIPSDTIDDVVDRCVYAAQCCQTAVPSPPLSYDLHDTAVQPAKVDYERLQPRFGWLPINTIKRTFEVTTQYARMPMSVLLKKRYRSPYPACNVPRRNEPVATDTVYSDTPAIDDGSTCAQLFVGTESLVTDVYGMKSDRQFVNTLEDNIRTRGAPTKLISDRAQVEIGRKVLDILRSLFISSWQSEPHQQHQNPAERRYQTVKQMTNTVLDRTGAPAYTWLLCMAYVCFLLNHTISGKGTVPLQASTGSTTDISPLLCFRFYEPVYYKVDDSDFPSESRERRGRWVGIADHVGHVLTFKVLTDDTRKVITRSNIRSADDPVHRNLRLDPLLSTNVPPVVKSRSDAQDHGEAKQPGDDGNDSAPDGGSMPVFDPIDIIGRTFLSEPQEDGQRFRVRIVRALDDHVRELSQQPDRLQFVCSVNDDQFEEIMSYNDILQHLERTQAEDDVDGNTVWRFKRISGHQGPLSRNDPDYKGSSYNVQVEWENGEVTYEPLSIIAADDPVTCAIYAREQNLLHVPGWTRFKKIAQREKKLLRMVNQAKLRSYRTAPRYKYGYEVPRDFAHAKQLDERNGNTRWMDATDLEFSQLHEYEAFLDYGKHGRAPEGYKKIRVHVVYDCKHDGRHKARLVAGGHLTEVPLESVYSGVVSLRGVRLLVFLAELNGLETWATDIGNAYLEALTSERVYIVAGPEFGDYEGHTLVIYKALYGLRSSGLRWHERFADCLRDMGFFPCRAEPDIWMRHNGEIYEYVAVYVDDLAIAVKDPKVFVHALTSDHRFKLKGTGPISFHLGCDFFRDRHGTMCMAPRKYIDKMTDTYERLFGSKPSTKVTSPLEKGDHPELDTSEFLDASETQQYQSLIGALQWSISIGRFDVATAVMTLSSFRAAPRRGHMDRIKRIYGYLHKMRDGVIRFRTDEPDYSALPDQDFDWAQSVYGNVKEVLPKDAPKPLGKHVTLTHYFDANLYHDMVSGRSVTGILHLINKTPIDWFSKKQETVETATYGSEFIAARTCVDQIIDLRNTLRYLGVPVRERSYMFGDNKAVVDSSVHPHSKLHKRHNALSFHRVREAIASKYVSLHHLPGEHNPSDILSKHWGYQQIWKLLQPILFYSGDTAGLYEE